MSRRIGITDNFPQDDWETRFWKMCRNMSKGKPDKHCGKCDLKFKCWTEAAPDKQDE